MFLKHHTVKGKRWTLMFFLASTPGLKKNYDVTCKCSGLALCSLSGCVFYTSVFTLEALIQFGKAKLLDIRGRYQLHAPVRPDFITPEKTWVQRSNRLVTSRTQWHQKRSGNRSGAKEVACMLSYMPICTGVFFSRSPDHLSTKWMRYSWGLCHAILRHAWQSSQRLG